MSITGVGLHGLRAPATELDLGNSGTAMRLMAGLMSGQPFDCVLTGDESLNGRPMNRIVRPLTMMGAAIESDCDGSPPLQITGAIGWLVRGWPDQCHRARGDARSYGTHAQVDGRDRDLG